MTLPNELYSIYIYDQDGNPYFYFVNWDRLEYAQRVNDPWNHAIQARFAHNDPRVELLRNLKRDFFVLIYRTDPATEENKLVYEGFHATSTEQVLMSGDIFFSLYGGGYTKLLERRVVIPRYGEDASTKSGVAETVTKQFVYESMVVPATAYVLEYISQVGSTGTNVSYDKTAETEVRYALDEDRIMRGFSVATDQQRGPQVEYSANYTQLETVIKNCVGEDLRFGVERGPELGTFVFDARPIWGTDRRKDNPAGNTPMLFSLARGNMILPIYSINHRLEKNYIYVGGEGSGKDRTIATVIDKEAQEKSPWGRTEAFTSVTKTETSVLLLETAGAAYLKKNKAQVSLDFEIRQTRTSRWLQDWEMGDFITAEYAGQFFDKEIREVSVVVTGGEAAQSEEVITVELGDV